MEKINKFKTINGASQYEIPVKDVVDENGASLVDTNGIADLSSVGKVKDVKVDGASVLGADGTAAIDLSGKQDALTATQQAAVDSGINATKVGSYDALVNATTIAGYGITDAYTKTEVDAKDAAKQDALTTAQLAAANSGVTTAKVASYDALVSATTLAGYGITDAYTKTETDTKIDDKVKTLDKADTAVADQYVSAVAETDGIISVSREKIPVKDVTVDGTSVVTSEKAQFITAVPTETKFTTNADGTINTPTKLEVATSKASGLILGTDVPTIKSYVDDKIDEKLILAGSGEMNVLEGVKVGGTALAISGKNVNIELDETKATGDNGVKSVTLAGGKVKTEYDKFVEAAATSGIANQYGFFSGTNELTGKIIADAYAAVTAGSASAFDEASGVYTIPTTKAIHDYLDKILGGISGAMSFKGDMTGSSALIFDDNSVGWTFIVGTAGTYAGEEALVGDMFIVNSVSGGIPTYTHVSATTTVVDAAASIGTTLTKIGSVNGTDITAKVDVTPISGGAQVTTAETKIATVAGKDITAKLKDSSVAYTPGSVTGSGDSQVIVYPTLVSSTADGVVQGSDVAKISSYVVDYCDKMATAAGAGEMNKVDDVKIDGVSIVASKVASIPDGTTAKKGVVQLADAYSDTDSAKAATGATIKEALETLDVTEVGGTGKIVKAISETDGKISATVVDAVTKVTTPAATNVVEYTIGDSATKVEVPKATDAIFGGVQLDKVLYDSAHTDKVDTKVMTAKAVMDSMALTKKDGNVGAAYGYSCDVDNSYALAFGESNTATGWGSVAIGSHVDATKTGAVALGRYTLASGVGAFAEGKGSGVDNPTTASGDGSHAEGVCSKATNESAHAEGGFGTNFSTASGMASHAEGASTASGTAAHSEGLGSEASGNEAHAEGKNTLASATASHAEGEDTKATAVYAHAEGHGSEATASSAHAEGENCKAQAANSHAEGYGVTVSSTATGAHGEGFGGIIQGEYCHKEGYATQAKGNYSHVEGCYSQAIGNASHAEGNSECRSDTGHSEGYLSVASGGRFNHVEGFRCEVVGGDGSHAEGKCTIARNIGEHACGIGNKSDGGQIFSIGIGVTGGIDPDTGTEIGPDRILDSNRKNAIAVHSVGNIYVYGVGGYDGTNFGAAGGAKTLQQVLNEAGGGGVTDVKVDGASVVTSGVANVPDASTTQKGVIKTDTSLSYTNKVNPSTGAGIIDSTSETDETVPTSKAIVTELAKFAKFVEITQAAYDALAVKDPMTIYCITD